jgi:uncharacterized damage-inducible protein DinB
MNRPETNEYPPYFANYIAKVPEGNVFEYLSAQQEETDAFLAEIPEERGNFRYAEDKWSIKEVMGHVADTERIFAYRILCIARGEKASLPSFDQNEYVQNANFAGRSLKDIAAELSLLRASNLSLFRSFDDETGKRKGKANLNEITVRSLIYMIGGHAAHHLDVIKDKYLVS